MSLPPAVVFHVEGLEPAPTPSAAAPLPCGLSLEGEARPAALPLPLPSLLRAPCSQAAGAPLLLHGGVLSMEGCGAGSPGWTARFWPQVEATFSMLGDKDAIVAPSAFLLCLTLRSR